ncbi:MAG: hypothetical protein ACTSYI_09070 [Promethearchaeota archaeon]
MLATSLSLVGIYGLLLFLYKVLNSAVLLQYSIRIGFSALLFAVYLLFCTLQVLLYSSYTIKNNKVKFIIWFVIAVIVAGLMAVTDWISVENGDITTMEYNLAVFLPFAVYIAVMLIYSMIVLYSFAIKAASDTSKPYLWLFFFGLLSMFCGLLTEGLSAAFEGLTGLFDILLFVFLAFGVMLMALSLLRKDSSYS